jgi:class 3 adenylate cyclase
VNLAARLQASAGAGEIVLSEAVYARLSSPPDLAVTQLDVKGSDRPVPARVVPSLLRTEP